MARLDTAIGTVEHALEAMSGVQFPRNAEFYDDLAPAYAAMESSLRGELGSVAAALTKLLASLQLKRSRPFHLVTLDLEVPSVLSVVAIESVISQHNGACGQFDQRVASARDTLEADAVAGSIAEYCALRDASRFADEMVSKRAVEVARLEQEVATLERDIVEHRQPAEELNQHLCNYLGHADLQLDISDTGYSIRRLEGLATNVSEGESTAIALLYFLKTLHDKRFTIGNGVVVLDDPVSSLDQNALFGAFGHIRAVTCNAGQLFILTHNFIFFRLIRDWFRNLRGRDKRSGRILMLESVRSGSGRASSLKSIDPLLMEYESEYHYLFSKIYRLAVAAPTGGLDEYYGVPSMARRVLETFLAFRVPGGRGENSLWMQMQEMRFETGKAARVYRYVQTHAHRNIVGEPDEDLTLLAESRSILNDLLTLMRGCDPDHVSRMISLVTGIGLGTGEAVAEPAPHEPLGAPTGKITLNSIAPPTATEVESGDL